MPPLQGLKCFFVERYKHAAPNGAFSHGLAQILLALTRK
jgi:hypothetical protein